MMPRRPLTGRLGCGGTAGNGARFRRLRVRDEAASELGQEAGAGIGALVLLYGFLASLGWVAALCAAAGVVVLILSVRPPKQTRR
jgi:hypothetical protein